MLKFPVFILLVMLTTGCMGPSIVIGELVPLQRDIYGKNYVYAPSSIFNEIVYKDFAFDWRMEDGFIIYPEANSPIRANWSSIYVDPANKHTAFFSVMLLPHYMEKSDCDALMNYAKRFNSIPEGSKIRQLFLKTEKCKFKGQNAIFITSSNREAGRELYTRDEGYLFPHPLYPERFFIFITWSERGTKDNYQDPRIAEQGKKFFQNFRLLHPEKSESQSK